ncbi:hypothetical protein F6X40_09565 [Paraburkholderia sp. UCT31]|uniref:hypothetical protein n=1 Tax=Paraburkholderia sp. UCT31 TaxID=2615209 RepID=UPI00165557A2|nr:hypothetical protein [Paraburkholderia sp. UCT31]MBC8737056.1 hypothetical protein [Paraburkholderia sp. UCT31]
MLKEKEREELELLRRLADDLRWTVRMSEGVHSVRTRRMEPWEQTDVHIALQAVNSLQGEQPDYWKIYPPVEAGVFVFNGQRVKIVPVEPTERQVKDDNANDPPSQALPFLHQDTMRHVWRSMMRVGPVLEPDANLVAHLLAGLPASDRQALLARCAQEQGASSEAVNT